MCYDVQTKLETLLKRAIRFHDIEGIKRIKEELGPYLKDHFHTSGFAHQPLLIYQNDKPDKPSPASWGLVPHWVKNQKQKLEIWNKTINARGETIFEKPSSEILQITKDAFFMWMGSLNIIILKENLTPVSFLEKTTNLWPLVDFGANT